MSESKNTIDEGFTTEELDRIGFLIKDNAFSNDFLITAVTEYIRKNMPAKDFTFATRMETKQEMLLRTGLEELRAAWDVEGSNPDYHNKMKAQLVQSWPFLHNAIAKLISIES